MYHVRYTKKFSKSFRRLVRGGLKKSAQADVQSVIEKIASGKKLAVGYRDHKLKGELSDYRECHIQGDLLLIYQIVDKELVLLLVDIGTHSELFK